MNKVGFSKRNSQGQLLASAYTHVPPHMQTSLRIHNIPHTYRTGRKGERIVLFKRSSCLCPPRMEEDRWAEIMDGGFLLRIRKNIPKINAI